MEWILIITFSNATDLLQFKMTVPSETQCLVVAKDMIRSRTFEGYDSLFGCSAKPEQRFVVTSEITYPGWLAIRR